MNSEISLFQLASRRLQWLTDGQKVVSENIANADVAEYRAREVESFDAYLVNNAGSSTAAKANVLEVQSSWTESLSGNNVVLEEQLMEASSINGQYRVAAALYQKAHDLLRVVSSGR